MIHYYNGTVFNTPAKTIVNTVNCFGVMGAGIALEYKLRFPKMFDDYKKQCDNKEIYVGRPKIYPYSDDRWIMNFPTKNHWRNPSKLEYIEEGLAYFVENHHKVAIDSIAFPKLGTKNGGLDWKHVKKVMEEHLSKVDIDVYICLDELQNAEGVEAEMLNNIKSASDTYLKEEVGLTKTQTIKIRGAHPITRFWQIRKIKGIGEKTYEKIFNHFYGIKYNLIPENKISEKREKYHPTEQLSLF